MGSAAGAAAIDVIPDVAICFGGFSGRKVSTGDAGAVDGDDVMAAEATMRVESETHRRRQRKSEAI